MLERALGVRVINVWASWIISLQLVSPPVGCEGNNVWTAWSPWSECSFTCGRGIKSRYRECVGHTDRGLIRLANPTCRGRTREYWVCKKPPCPVGEDDERKSQCSEHNTDVILGMLYHWVPFYGGSSPCELTCLARGYSFYYNFGSVKDGTLCKRNLEDLCVNGHCAKVGCDGQVGSHAEIDDCGVCGGQNTKCVFFKHVYAQPLPKSGEFGYNEIVKIPAGATQLKIEDDSHNYLAIADARRTYIINGNWVIDWPGRYDVAGTTIFYGRSGPDNETITADGPVKEDLYLMLIFRGKNKGVKYQFWLPSEKLSEIKLGLTPNSTGGSNDNTQHDKYTQPTNTAEGTKYEQNIIRNTKKSEQEKSYFRLNTQTKSRLQQQKQQQGTFGIGYSNSNMAPQPLVPGDVGKVLGEDYPKRSESAVRGQNHFPQTARINDNIRNQQDYKEHDISETQAWWEALKRRPTKKINLPYVGPHFDDDSYSKHKIGLHVSEWPQTTYRPLSKHVQPTSSLGLPAQEPKLKTAQRSSIEKHRKTNEIDHKKESCGMCPKSKNRARHFCTSQFVVRMKVLKIEETGMGNDTRYDVKIVDRYKDSISLLSREYLWVPNRCNCPRIQRNKEYIVMGSLVTDSREGRLQLVRNSFVRPFNIANENRMRNLLKRINCDKYG